MVEHNSEEGELGGESTVKPQQPITKEIADVHTQQIIDVQNKQRVTANNLAQIVEGVDFLTIQVTTLNERVYTKNYLDRIRNELICGFIITFVIVSFILVILLHNQSTSDDKRAQEAIISRRQIADCTVKPGVVLDQGYVNPGKCYQEGAIRTGEAVNKITKDITEEVRQLLIESKNSDSSNG